jgi:hypothetical protein
MNFFNEILKIVIHLRAKNVFDSKTLAIKAHTHDRFYLSVGISNCHRLSPL